MADRDEVSILVRLRNAAGFKRDADKTARSIDNIGDQAQQAARKMQELNASSAASRISLGPISTNARFGAIAFGAMALATENLTGKVLGLGEAAVTVGAGGAAAGAVGLSALGQGVAVLKLGVTDLTDALGGNAAALKRLTPEMQGLFLTLNDAQDKLKGAAQKGFMPGLTDGIESALKNLPVLTRVVRRTGGAVGGLAKESGAMLGSGPWGKDFAAIGNRNVKIIDNLGHGALALADGARHILVEAGPLAEWLSEIAENGAKAADSFLAQKRASGDLAKFFHEARIEIGLLGAAGGHGARGLLNLFGAQDVDGTKTLANFNALMGRFERWTKLPNTQAGVGQAIVDQIPKLAGPLAVALANTFGEAAPKAAGIFWKGFWGASAQGKAVIGAAVLWKTGAFKALGSKLFNSLGSGGAAGKVGKGLLERGATPGNPLWVQMVGGPGGYNPGSTKGWEKKIPPAAGGGLGAALRAAGGTAARSSLGAVGVAAVGGVLIGKAAQLGDDGRSNPNSNTYAQLPADIVRKGPLGMGLPNLIPEIHNHFYVDGREVTTAVTKNVQKSARRK